MTDSLPPQGAPVAPQGDSFPPQGVPVAPSAGDFAAEPALNQPYPGISFGEAISRFFKKYATFSGRASRAEFWWVVLFCVIVNVALNAIVGILPSVSFLGIIWTVVILIPSLALYVRRLHDSNKPGAFVLLPYGLGIVGSVLSIITVGQFTQGLADALGVDVSQVITAAQQLGQDEVQNVLLSLIETGRFGITVAMLLISILLVIIAGIFGLVFALLGSKPEGARFDK